MRVIVCDSESEAADLVAAEIVGAVRARPDLTLGLATGSTPIGVYQRLVRAHREGLDLSALRTFNLDEYVGLPADHPQSYRAFMLRHLFDAIDLPATQWSFPPTEGPELRRRCAEFEETIRAAGGIDIQLLGVGRNGHIGFNEPTSSLASRTRVVTLTERTLADNRRFYGDSEAQPELAVTMGIGTIIEARTIILQAFGGAKAEAIRATVEGPVTAACPASALQLHPEVTLVLDRESAAALSQREFYARAWRHQRELEQRGEL